MRVFVSCSVFAGDFEGFVCRNHLVWVVLVCWMAFCIFFCPGWGTLPANIFSFCSKSTYPSCSFISSLYCDVCVPCFYCNRAVAQWVLFPSMVGVVASYKILSGESRTRLWQVARVRLGYPHKKWFLLRVKGDWHRTTAAIQMRDPGRRRILHSSRHSVIKVQVDGNTRFRFRDVA